METVGREDQKTTSTTVQEKVEAHHHSGSLSPALFKQHPEEMDLELTKTGCESSSASNVVTDKTSEPVPRALRLEESTLIEGIKLIDLECSDSSTKWTNEGYAIVSEQSIGPEGGTVELGWHEIKFPKDAVDMTIHTKFSVSLGNELDLPGDLIPISHVLHYSPGKQTFNKNVEIKMPVWFKLGPTMRPINIHVYSHHKGEQWELEESLELGTANRISFSCRHFCRKVVAISPEDITDAEISIDSFLCMNKTGNLLSCHCVSTEFMVDTLVKRMKESDYKVIHPAISRICEKLGAKVPVSLDSWFPKLYIIEPENGYTLTINKNFYQKHNYESFSFTLSFLMEKKPVTFSLTYKVERKSFSIRQRSDEVSHPSAGDHWPCLRRSDVYASMTHKEYPAHEKSKEIFGADSGKGENSTEVVSSSGKVFQKRFKVEAAGRGDMKTTRTLVQEDVKEQRHSEMPSPTLSKQQTEAKLVEMTKTPCESNTAGIFPDFVHMDGVRDPRNPAKRSPTENDPRPTEKEPVKQKKLKIVSEEKCDVINDRKEVIECQDKSGCLAFMSNEEIQSTENTAKLIYPKSNEIPKDHISPMNLEEPEEMFDVSLENDSKLPREQPVEQQEQQITGEEEANVIGAEKGVIQWHEDSANLTSTSSEETGSTEETVKSNHPKSFSPITLEQLEEMMDHSFCVEKEIGPSEAVIKLQSYEIIFPANAVDQPTKTKFRLAFLTENLHLPSDLIPIAHPIFCSPGKTIFRKDVTLKIPVWFKKTDTSPTAKPINVYLYARSSGNWEVIDSVKLGTSERITFKCKHFCPILPCVEMGDLERGEFTLTYLLCTDDDDNFISYHFVASEELAKVLVHWISKCKLRVIHPPTTAQTVKPNMKIPVSLTSKQPQIYEFECDDICTLAITEKFYKQRRCEDFRFEVIYHGPVFENKIRFTYQVGEKKRRISCRQANKHSYGTGLTEHQENTGKDVNVHIHNNISEKHAGVSVQDNGSAVLHGSVPENAMPSSHPTPTSIDTDLRRMNFSIQKTNANISVSGNGQCKVNQTDCSNTVDARAAQAEQPQAHNEINANIVATEHGELDLVQDNCVNYAVVGETGVNGSNGTALEAKSTPGAGM